MSAQGMMPPERDLATMWALRHDRRTLRFSLPPVPLAGLTKPLKLHVDFDAAAVGAMILQLTNLRVRWRGGRALMPGSGLVSRSIAAHDAAPRAIACDKIE